MKCVAVFRKHITGRRLLMGISDIIQHGYRLKKYKKKYLNSGRKFLRRSHKCLYWAFNGLMPY